MSGPDQSRWVTRPASSGTSDEAAVIVVQVVDGEVLVDAPRGPVAYSPRDVERLRQALADARALALWERGDW